MNPKYRILIPVGLAVVAAIANFVLLQQATATTGVLVLSRDVPAGQPITRADLIEARVRADKLVFDAAYPAANYTELLNLTFRRDMKAGWLVLKTDADVNGKDLLPGPNERDCSLLVSAERLPLELTANERVEFTLPDPETDSVKVGPFRVLSVRPVVGRRKDEYFSRVTFAGPDVSGAERVKLRFSDEFKLGEKTLVNRAGKGVTGKQVNTRTQGE